MAQVPTGTTFQLYTSLAAAKVVSAITNATEAVVTSTAHGYANGDIVFMESGWGRINKRAFRIKAVTANEFTLEGMNTSNTTFYTPGSGAGSAYRATTPVQVTQVLASTTQGGDAKLVSFKYIESDVEFSINDGFTAISRNLEIDADSLGTPGYSLLQSLTETGGNTVLKTTLKGGSFTVTPGTVAMNEEVILQDGQVNRVRTAFNATNRSTRYAA